MTKILIIRFSSIGDIVLTTPVIRCVHRQMNAEVHVLTKQAFTPILAENPYVNKVHSLEVNLSDVIQELQREKFDLVIDLHKNLRSRQVRRALDCPGVTFDKLNLQKWLLTVFKVDRLPRKHLVDRYFEAIARFGVKNDGAGLDYFISTSDQVDPTQWVNGPYLVLVLGAAHTTKQIPIGKLIAIVEENEQPVLLVGGPGEKAIGDQVVLSAKSKKQVFNLAGQLSLGGSADVIRQAAAVITPDTGMMHIAAAFHRPIVSVWGNTVPEFGMYPYFPIGKSREKTIQVEGLACRPCSKIGYDQCPKGHFQCMEQQSAKLIVHAVLELSDINNK